MERAHIMGVLFYGENLFYAIIFGIFNRTYAFEKPPESTA